MSRASDLTKHIRQLRADQLNLIRQLGELTEEIERLQAERTRLHGNSMKKAHAQHLMHKQYAKHPNSFLDEEVE